MGGDVDAETVAPGGSLLERRFPGLRGRRAALGDLPTPIRTLDVGGGRQLWVKDESRSAESYGGNKVRKLAWLLPRLAGRRSLVTVGAVGSNHVLATAHHAGRVGLRTHAVLVPQPDAPGVRRNAAVTAALAHRTWPASNEVAAVGALARAVGAAWREDGRRPAVVWIGGSTPVGLLGWVEAALELDAQVTAGLLPAPARIVVPAGSGGVAAGLLVGLSLTGLRAEVHAVRVADPVWANRGAIAVQAHAVRRVLRRAGADVPRPDLRRLTLDTGWLGGGYGSPTAAGTAAAELAGQAGMVTEPTYSAKALAAALHLARRDPRPLLWIDTANARPLEPLVGGTLPALPRSLERALTSPPPPAAR
jgi:D-cysteine desulfhydrase